MKSSQKALIIFSLCLITLSIVGIFDKIFWISDLVSHFRIQYLILGILGLVVTLVLMQKKVLIYFLFLTVLAVNSIYVFQYRPSRWEKSFEAYGLKIISFNLNRANRKTAEFKRYIQTANPDVLMVYELTPEWAQVIGQMKDVFPFAQATIQNDNFGIGILSKHPLSKTVVRRLSQAETPVLETRMIDENFELNLIALHAFPPITSEAKGWRDNYLLRVSNFVQKLKGESVVCGDFNQAPWATSIKNFLEQSGLSLSQGHFALPTWPTTIPGLRIPIDHCFVSQGLSVVDYRRGPDIGSDHFPIELTIALKGIRSLSSD